MPAVDDLAQFLETFAPRCLAEDWDNVGLLVGDRHQRVDRVMTCLTITPASAREAVDGQADLIVTHHPLPFREFRQLTSDTNEGRMLLELIAGQVAIYSPHTAFDSAAQGINQQLAAGLGLEEIAPLRPIDVLPMSSPGEPTQQPPVALGSGRYGRLPAPCTVADLANRVKQFLRIERLQLVGSPETALRQVGVACGSAGEFLRPARKLGCNVLITGETSFHTCLEAEATGVALLLTGHYASERFGVERLAEVLQSQFPQMTVWASREEADPLRWV